MSFFEFANKPEILIGDCLEKLQTLHSKSIDCCVTSPPYYNLRNYENDRQIGMEDTPEAYILRLVEVFQEVHRVLKDTGTLWLNIGDSYANDDKWGGSSGGKHAKSLHGATSIGRGRRHTGLKPKDLIGIPWELAFALRQAGWYLRSDIIWHKSNVMPESIKDRPTKSHEYVFLLSKSKLYYYDADAISEPSIGGHVRGPALHPDNVSTNGNGGLARRQNAPTRNRRSVWTINTKPFRGAHFAVMPQELAELCILAGTSEQGCCPSCGAPWRRFKLGWQPSCVCPEQAPVPSTVLDPFGGAGTTGVVAQRLGRRSVLIELNSDYADIIRQRVQ